MAAVDRDVYATTDGARYATAIYGSLDAATRRFTIVNAGHPPALLLDPHSDAIARIAATGPALGLIAAGTFASRTVTIPRGGVLVAYTDGVSEARNADDDEYGDDRLGALLADSRGRSAAALCTRILDTIRQYRGSRQDQDDVTVLVVRAL